MFTNETSKWTIAFILLAMVTIGGAMVTGRIVATGEESVTAKVEVIEETAATIYPDPNAFTSTLDSLRYMGQTEALRAATESRLSEIFKNASVYEYSSDVAALGEVAGVSDANEFISQFDRLRETGQSPRLGSLSPAGEVFDYTSQLDTLRAKAAAVSLSDRSYTDKAISDANEFSSTLDSLR